jgi:hypothetical protein
MPKFTRIGENFRAELKVLNNIFSAIALFWQNLALFLFSQNIFAVLSEFH